jgi:MFS family permease
MVASGFGSVAGPMVHASAMTTLGALPAFLLSAQAVLIRDELEFDEVSLGLLVGTFFGAAAVTAVLSASFIDALGRRRSTVLAGLTAGSGGLLLASSARSFVQLLIAMVGLGVANALLQLTANLVLARGTPAHRQGLAFGVKQSAVPLALLLGGLAVPLLGASIGWRWPLAVAGLAGLVVVGSGLVSPDVSAPRATSVTGRQRPPLIAVALTAIAMAVASAAVNSLGAFLPSWAHVVGLGPSQAGVLVAAGVASRSQCGCSPGTPRTAAKAATSLSWHGSWS